MSSSSRPFLVRLEPFLNSSLILRASTTVQMQSRTGTPPLQNSGPMLGMEHIVCAIGAGSQMPLASMTM